MCIRVSTENNIFEMFENSKETCENIIFDKHSKMRKFRKSFSISIRKYENFENIENIENIISIKTLATPTNLGPDVWR